jgi:hypothetical protein
VRTTPKRRAFAPTKPNILLQLGPTGRVCWKKTNYHASRARFACGGWSGGRREPKQVDLDPFQDSLASRILGVLDRRRLIRAETS